MRHVLMVEDDARVSSFLSRGLRAEGYTVAVVERGDVALEAVRQYKPDLLLLDVMLPGMNGIAVCQELRAAQQHLPILMLTAMDALEDKVTGLRCGADDYHQALCFRGVARAYGGVAAQSPCHGCASGRLGAQTRTQRCGV